MSTQDSVVPAPLLPQPTVTNAAITRLRIDRT